MGNVSVLPPVAFMASAQGPPQPAVLPATGWGARWQALHLWSGNLGRSRPEATDSTAIGCAALAVAAAAATAAVLPRPQASAGSRPPRSGALRRKSRGLVSLSAQPVDFVDPGPSVTPFGPAVGPLRPTRPPASGEEEPSWEEQEVAGCNEELSRLAEAGDAEEAAATVEGMWKRKLEPNRRSYLLAIEACTKAQSEEAEALAEKLRTELEMFGPEEQPERFQLAPNVQWNRQVRQVGCGIRNTLNWKGRPPLPVAPHSDCWLIPTQDEAAVDMAWRQNELRHLGWKVLSCKPEIVDMLRNKNSLHEHFRSLGLGEYVPERFHCPRDALYPCILKPACGTFGKDTCVAYCSDDVVRTAYKDQIWSIERRIQQEQDYMATYYTQHGQEKDQEEMWAETAWKTEEAVQRMLEEKEREELWDKWMLQELLPGPFEYSTTLLVFQGEILDVAGTRYEYDADIYVWPRVELINTEYVAVPGEHLDVMRAALEGFSGICNFNYKLRPDGKICIFEANPRVGGDLAFDVPKPRVRALFEKLDALDFR